MNRLTAHLINLSIFIHIIQMYFYSDVIYSLGMLVLTIGWLLYNIVWAVMWKKNDIS